MLDPTIRALAGQAGSRPSPSERLVSGALASPDARPARIDALTSLRFVAAALIVVHHAQADFGIGRVLDARAALDQAVGFFFVLSGFILTYTYSNLRLRQAGHFFRARFARIYPMHLATFALVFVLFDSAHRTKEGLPNLRTALVNLTLTQSWFDSASDYFSYNGPSWSVSTEVAFYALFPLLVWNLRRTWHVKLLAAAGLLAATVAYVAARPNASLAIPAYINPCARLLEFTLGMAAALAWERFRTRARTARLASTAIEVGLLVLCAAAMFEANRWADALRFGFEPAVWLPVKVWLVHGGIAALPFAALIAVFALQRGWVSRALSLRPFVFLGEISFSVYLLHHLMIRYFHLHRDALDWGFGELGTYAAFWALLLLASHVASTLVEVPARRLIAGRGLPAPGGGREVREIGVAAAATEVTVLVVLLVLISSHV